MKSNKGFTLIELLVVIAIIGILSSVVLASLNTAREKGSDAAIKANLNGVRAQAELVYDDDGNYDAVCDDPNVSAARVAAGEASGAAANAICGDSAAGWVIYSPLKSDPATAYCTDYKGNADEYVKADINVLDYDCDSNATTE